MLGEVVNSDTGSVQAEPGGWLSIRNTLVCPRASQTCAYEYRSSGDLVKMLVLTQQVWSGTQNSSFLTSSLLMLMFLINRPHSFKKKKIFFGF